MPYYHAIISLKSRPEEDALATDLSEKELMDKIIRPRSEGRKFASDEELVDVGDIKSIRITKTEKPLDEIIGEDFVPTYTQYWEAANSGEDVTANYITEGVRDAKEFSEGVRSQKIFIVHGKDREAVLELKSVLTELGLDPVVLEELASGSMTIIEKLEKYSADVGFAFAILSPDDVGCEKQHFLTLLNLTKFPVKGPGYTLESALLGDMKPRARQNVLLEFGFLIGRLGRMKVCCLYKGNVELPSDMGGIVYVHFDHSVKECREKILAELKAAGYPIQS